MMEEAIKDTTSLLGGCSAKLATQKVLKNLKRGTHPQKPIPPTDMCLATL